MKRALFAMGLALAGLGGCSEKPQPARANVLLITIDTLRRDHVSSYGYRRETTPNLDRLAAEGLIFDNASTPRAKTSPALASLFTGSYPHEHGVRELLQPLDPEVPVLAQALRRAGYQCAAIVGNYVLQERHCGFARGFEHYIESLPALQGVPPNDVPQRTAASMTRAAQVALGLERAPEKDTGGAAFEPASQLLDRERPWFLWLHYMDPHGAYDPPPEQRVFQSEAPRWVDPSVSAVGSHKTRVSEYNIPSQARDARGHFDADAVIDLYDGEIRFADAEIGRLLDSLRAQGALENTWIVVSSDHGESLGEHDYWFEHGFYACEATCAVPLIVRPPDNLLGRPPPGRRQGAMSLADLGPTLAEWIDVPFRVAASGGPAGFGGASRASLLAADDVRPFATFSEKIEAADRLGTVQIKAVRLGRFKLIRRWAHGPGREPGETKRLKLLGEELYDLGADPLELRDLASDPPDDAPLDELRAALLEFGAADAPFEELERVLNRRRAALEASDADALSKLKALGY